MTPVERIRRIALLFQLKVQFAFQFSVFACVARIFLIGILVALWKRENCVHESIRSNQEWHNGDANRLITSPQRLPLLLGTNPRQNQQRDSLFVFSRTRALLFLVKKIFGRDENKISNKVHFFLVDFESDF